MTHVKALEASRLKELVPDDKFDCHIVKARLQDVDSKKTIFNTTTEKHLTDSERRKKIKTMTF